MNSIIDHLSKGRQSYLTSRKERKTNPRHWLLGIPRKPLIPHIPASLLPRGGGPTARPQPEFFPGPRALVWSVEQRPPACLPLLFHELSSWKQNLGRTGGRGRGLPGWSPHLLMSAPAAPQTWVTADLFRARPDPQGRHFQRSFPPTLGKRAPRQARLRSRSGAKASNQAQPSTLLVAVGAGASANVSLALAGGIGVGWATGGLGAWRRTPEAHSPLELNQGSPSSHLTTDSAHREGLCRLKPCCAHAPWFSRPLALLLSRLKPLPELTPVSRPLGPSRPQTFVGSGSSANSLSSSRKMVSKFHLDPILKSMPPLITSSWLRSVDFISEKALNTSSLLHFYCYSTSWPHHHHHHHYPLLSLLQWTHQLISASDPCVPVPTPPPLRFSSNCKKDFSKCRPAMIPWSPWESFQWLPINLMVKSKCH